MGVTLEELTKASIVSLVLFAGLIKPAFLLMKIFGVSFIVFVKPDTKKTREERWKKYILVKRDEKTGDGLDDNLHVSLRNRYLLIYGLAVFGDWLQGPYVYRLYLLHGLAESDIHKLFVIGFASSCVVGPFSGALWDVAGRKRGILCYG